jgi:hypothetical protein
MLQTQKFSPEQVEKVISEIEKSTISISDLLNNSEDFEKKIDKIIQILNTREPLFSLFSEITKDETLDVHFRNNHNRWLNRIKKIMDQEKINLEIIEKNMKLHSDKVKDLNKQKKLLLYKKREL